MKYKIIIHLLILVGVIQTPLINAMKRSLQSYNTNNDDDDNDNDNLSDIFNNPAFFSDLPDTQIQNIHTTSSNHNNQNLHVNAPPYPVSTTQNLINAVPPTSQILPQNQTLYDREQILNCPIKYCTKRFISEDLFRPHMLACHTHIYNLMQRSTSNGTIISNNNNNTNESFTHDQEAWHYYQCPHCDTKVNYQWELKIHAKNSHQHTYKSDQCKSLMQSLAKDSEAVKTLIEADIQNHQKACDLLKTLSNSSPSLSCTYLECKDKPPFFDARSLNRHIIAIHLNLRYVCRLAGCGFIITVENGLQSHLKQVHNYSASNISIFLRWQDPDLS